MVEDQSHPSTSGLGERFSLSEEFYTFRENPRPRVQVLLRLDPASVGSTGDYPLAWAQSYGTGRAYYNALGHFTSTWDDPRFQQQLIGAMGLGGGDSLGKMMSDARSIGEDIAKFLAKWARGDTLD